MQAAMAANLAGEAASLRGWRIRIFATTWMAYAGFYLCRKNFSVLMPLLQQNLGISKDNLAHAVFFYSLMYAVGQFIMGTLSDRFGPRRVVSAGMFVAASTSIGMAFFTDTPSLIVLQAINGLAQACGWSGLLKVMFAWFDAQSRGVVMAWWSTNYALGGFLATNFATFAATSAMFWSAGWQRGAWLPGVLLAVLGLVFVTLVREGPIEQAPAAPKAKLGLANLLLVAADPTFRIIAGAYFCLKLTRYSFLFWLPLYLTERLQFQPSEAGYSASLYELGGFAGVVAAGYVSDRLFSSRRFPVGALFMMVLAAACLLPILAASVGNWLVLPSIALIGFLTMGPDTLMGGAAVQDSATRETAATAAGFVNGTGSIGQFLSGYILAFVVQRYGWDTLFVFFAVLSLAGGLLLCLRWTHRVRREKIEEIKVECLEPVKS